MKQNIYKIIALVSVLLGVLGPQVASGKSVENSLSANSNSSTISLEVVSSPVVANSVDIAITPQSSCKPQDDTIRLDLLLWQGCNSLAIASTQSLPALAVVSQPKNIPSLVAQSGVGYSQPVSISSSQTQQNFIIPTPGLALRALSLEKRFIAVVTQELFIDQISFNQVDLLNTVMMRC